MRCTRSRPTKDVADPWILAVDLGTGGPKLAAVSLDGDLLAHAARPVPTRFSPDGGAVQDPAAWWAGLKAAAGDILATGARPDGVVGVGITGQWGSTVPVDEEGLPAGDCLLWADTRGGPYASKVMGGAVSVLGYSPANMLRWLQLTGGAPSPGGADPLGHELHLRHRQPEVYARTRTLMEPLDYLGLRLTGRRAATPASMTLSWLTDNRPGRTPRYAPELLRRSTRDPARLPELVPTGSVLGEMLPAVAAELGLPAGIPVVAGVPDLHTAYLGSGAVAPYDCHLTISTSAWIGCEVPFKRTDVLRQMASIPGIRPGTYLVANNHETAGACLQWLRDAVIAPADGLPQGPAPGYQELCALAASAPPGSRGAIFTPWLTGERSPVEDRSLRAAFLNLSMSTGRAEMVRAVLEGVAYNARWLLDAVEKFLRRPVPRLRIVGGGATSDLWCQIHADILGRPIEQVANPMHANLVGAAFFAAIALGRMSLGDVPARVRLAATFEPGPGARALHEPVYKEYRGLYGRLHSTYARLNRR